MACDAGDGSTQAHEEHVDRATHALSSGRDTTILDHNRGIWRSTCDCIGGDRLTVTVRLVESLHLVHGSGIANVEVEHPSR